MSGSDHYRPKPASLAAVLLHCLFILKRACEGGLDESATYLWLREPCPSRSARHESLLDMENATLIASNNVDDQAVGLRSVWND